MISFDQNSSKDEAFRFYTANADNVIKEAVSLLIDKAPRGDLTEEIALYKLSMMNRVQLYQAAIKSKEAAAIDKASQLLQDGLRGIADMVRIQASLDHMVKDKYSPEQVQTLLNEVVDIIFLVCNSAQRTDLAELIEKQIRKQVDITLRPRGVTFTPADDVQGMIDSVPECTPGRN